MPPSFILIILLIFCCLGYRLGKQRYLDSVDGKMGYLQSLPTFYGFYTGLWSIIPPLILMVIWYSIEPQWMDGAVLAKLPESMQELPQSDLYLVLNDIKNAASDSTLSTQTDQVILTASENYQRLQRLSHYLLSLVSSALSLAGIWFFRNRINKDHRVLNAVEREMTIMMVLCSAMAIFTTIGIVFSVLFEFIRFFKSVPVADFLFGLEWSPQTVMRSAQVGSSSAVPLFTGTLLVSLIAMIVALPIGLMSAIKLPKFTNPGFWVAAKPAQDVLVGNPTAVYGIFAALIVAPLLRETGADFGLTVSSESALAAGLVMGIIIIPILSSLIGDVMNAVSQSLQDRTYTIRAAQDETLCQDMFPAVMPGIVGRVLLAVSRAIGETIILVVAAGLAANLTFNPFEAVTKVTVQIVTLLSGDQEFDSPKTLAAFAFGLVLFILTLMLKVFVVHIVRKYREQYE